MGFRRLPIGPVFDHCQLNFKQCSFTHTARVLPSLTSIVCQVSMAFPLCCFPPRLSAQGRVDDPGTFLLVPPGSARDTVMRDMAHNPERSSGDIFRELQCRSPGRYQPLQIRTLQRGMRKIRAYLLETQQEQWQDEVIRGPLPR